jgi:NTP pyrophosphatase (non-canonical NTP hydrolase)
MADATATVADLKAAIVAFAAARGWEPFHSPKNLAMALASEAGELCGELRWLTADESRAVGTDPAKRQAVADELADVANIVFLLSHHTGIDLSEAVAAKLVKNAVKYPAPPP